MTRRLLILGSVFAGLGVAAGAFGAHMLGAYVAPHRLGTFEVAVRYQMYHALALLMLGLYGKQIAGPLLTWAGYLFTFGIVLFSGSLYLLVLTDKTWLGAVTPIGGVAFIAGWVLLATAAYRRPAA